MKLMDQQNESVAPLPSTYCKFCSATVSVGDYFCRDCGKKLKEKPVSLGPLPLLWLFVLSAFLPPFGIGLSIKYIRDQNEKARVVGWVSLLITAIVIILSVQFTLSAMQTINQQINSEMQNYLF